MNTYHKLTIIMCLSIPFITGQTTTDNPIPSSEPTAFPSEIPTFETTQTITTETVSTQQQSTDYITTMTEYDYSTDLYPTDSESMYSDTTDTLWSTDSESMESLQSTQSISESMESSQSISDSSDVSDSASESIQNTESASDSYSKSESESMETTSNSDSANSEDLSDSQSESYSDESDTNSDSQNESDSIETIPNGTESDDSESENSNESIQMMTESESSNSNKIYESFSDESTKEDSLDGTASNDRESREIINAQGSDGANNGQTVVTDENGNTKLINFMAIGIAILLVLIGVICGVSYYMKYKKSVRIDFFGDELKSDTDACAVSEMTVMIKYEGNKGNDTLKLS